MLLHLQPRPDPQRILMVEDHALATGAQAYIFLHIEEELSTGTIGWPANRQRREGVPRPGVLSDVRDLGSRCRQADKFVQRESQLLKLIAEGDRNRDIAEKLSITIKTIETHRLNLMRKLDAHNITDLVNWAFRLGIHSRK